MNKNRQIISNELRVSGSCDVNSRVRNIEQTQDERSKSQWFLTNVKNWLPIRFIAFLIFLAGGISLGFNWYLLSHQVNTLLIKATMILMIISLIGLLLQMLRFDLNEQRKINKQALEANKNRADFSSQERQ